MPTLTALELGLSFEEFLKTQGDAVGRPDMQTAVCEAWDQGIGLLSPAIVYDLFPVLHVGSVEARVGEATFALGRHADLLAPAQVAFVGVVTIGPRLEEQARVLRTSGRILDSFMLDAVGVFAAGDLIEVAHTIVEKDAAGRGWGVGAELAPGQLAGWDICEQRLVTGLLDVASIGVSVTDSGILVPQKSASLMVGMGPEYESAEVRSPCEYCDLRETCRFSH